jgi:hypothetical protein
MYWLDSALSLAPTAEAAIDWNLLWRMDLQALQAGQKGELEDETDRFRAAVQSMLSKRDSWTVVVAYEAVHADRYAAAQTGLFGLLGDERVQIIKLSETDRLAAYRRPFGLPMRPEYQTKADELQKSVTRIFGILPWQTASDGLPRFEPAVMVMLCTKGCQPSRDLRFEQKIFTLQK